jgi:alpha-beta hydrolase superfamily lysophospholipase
VVQLSHGLGEHARRYDHVAEALNRAGFAVYADDHRGHGQTGVRQVETQNIKSQGNLGPGGMQATFAEVLQLTHLIRSEHKLLPIILLGHSWGSMIAQNLINKHSKDYDAMVLSGSAVLLPGLLPNGGDNSQWNNQPDSTGKEWLSRDREVGLKFVADPLNFAESAIEKFGLFECLKMVGIPSKKIRSELPILLQVGEKDTLGGEPANVRLMKLYRRAGIKDIELISYSDARHEVYNEINKTEVLADLVGWLNARF